MCLSKTAWLNGLHGLSTWSQLLHIHKCITTLVIHYMQVQHIDFPQGKYVIRMHFSSVECSAGWCRATGFNFEFSSFFFSDTPNGSAENHRGARGNVAGHKTEAASRERLRGCSRWVPYFDRLSFLWNQRRYQFCKTLCACLLRWVTLKRGGTGPVSRFSAGKCVYVFYESVYLKQKSVKCNESSRNPLLRQTWLFIRKVTECTMRFLASCFSYWEAAVAYFYLFD